MKVRRVHGQGAEGLRHVSEGPGLGLLGLRLEGRIAPKSQEEEDCIERHESLNHCFYNVRNHDDVVTIFSP